VINEHEHAIDVLGDNGLILAENAKAKAPGGSGAID
jgi:hypothetical protein